jgi:hypothetical protein
VKLGAEPTKVGVLVALVAAAGGIFYYQMSSGPETPSTASARTTPPPAARPARSAADQLLEGGAVRPRPSQRSSTDFKPTLKRTKQGETLDPAKVDPTLRLDLLAKVQGVGYPGTERNLFLFGAAKPKAPPPPTEPIKPLTAANGGAPKPGGNDPPPAPVKPPPPPITMKYFGFANRPGDARRRAFFLDGEEIYVAAEGELIKKRYKIVRIGVNSVVVEDVDHQSQQTLPLQEG